jgi:hypothetical protein
MVLFMSTINNSKILALTPMFAIDNIIYHQVATPSLSTKNVLPLPKPVLE